MTAIENRYEFVFLFDVTNGNPNGDPDAGNLPRLDPETNKGLVTDVCLKRKIRNYATVAREGETRYGIYVQEGAILNEKHRKAFIAARPDDEEAKTEKKLSPRTDEEEAKVRKFMCDNYFDVRTFGAVMSTGINCGQVRGPVQLSFARSIERIMPLEISITRMAATNEAEAKDRKTDGEDKDRRDNRTMGRKHIVPYGLYRAHGYVSAPLAKRTGFDEADLEFLWTTLGNMFDHDRSAARGEMQARRLIVFRHDSALGNAPAGPLFDRVTVARRHQGADYDPDGPGTDNLPPARAFSDYAVHVDGAGMPAGVTLIERF